MNDSLLTLDETGAEPDEVVVRTDEYGVLICPDGREPVESLTCPTLPVDGGTVFCDLDMGSDTENTVRGHRVYIGAMIMDDTLPAWVRALYGPAVASTTERMLSQTSAAAVSQTIETTWRQRPTATARALHRLMLGIWMRRYWPSPDDGHPWTIPDRILIDLETAALAASSELKPCLTDNALARHLLRRSRGALCDICRTVSVRGADYRLAARLERVLRIGLALVREEAEDHGERERLTESESLAAGLDGGITAKFEEPGVPRRNRARDHDALRARGYRLEPFDEKAVDAGTAPWQDTIDWGNNARGLFDTRSGAVRYDVRERDGNRVLRIEAPLAPNWSSWRRGPRCAARVCLAGKEESRLVWLERDDGCMTGEIAFEEEEGSQIECVDVVSVRRPRPPRTGTLREQMRTEQERATQWAWQRVLNNVIPDVLPASLVPKIFDAATPWLGEMTGADGLMELDAPVLPDGASGDNATTEDITTFGKTTAVSRTSVLRVHLDRFVLAAADQTTSPIEEHSRVEGLELRIASITASRVVVTTTAETTIAQPLDVVVFHSETEAGPVATLVLILAPDTERTLSGSAVISTRVRQVSGFLEMPKPLKDLDESLAPVISTSVRAVSARKGEQAWIKAARSLPQGHWLRNAIFEGFSS